MRQSDKVIAIACADIHLSHKPPICRSREPNWYAAMARPINELRELQRTHNCPLLCAGDIFDRWDSGPELINWTIRSLPPMIAIPGQHDLPQHRLEDIEKSAYWTILRSHSPYAVLPVVLDEFIVYRFPWGVPIKYEKDDEDNGLIKIAMSHQYTWMSNHSYPGAPEESHIQSIPGIRDFDIVIFGDNHNGFVTYMGNQSKKTWIVNCGTLMRRKSDEKDYQPMVGLIMSDGTVLPHYLDISKDILDPAEKEPNHDKIVLDVQEFMEQLEGLASDPLDFRDAVSRYCSYNKVGPKVQQVLNQLLEKGNK